jgi:hypothetical protein
MRTKNILGFHKMLQAINNWQPDYNKVACALKKSLMQVVYGLNEALFYNNTYSLVFLKAA